MYAPLSNVSRTFSSVTALPPGPPEATNIPPNTMPATDNRRLL